MNGVQMVTNGRTIWVRFSVEGWHRWPSAPDGRAYLSSAHRHLFKVQVFVNVNHSSRDIEFHDLLDFAKASFGSGDFGTMSCEAMAERLASRVLDRWPGRAVAVEVSEDGECGAVVDLTPNA